MADKHPIKELREKGVTHRAVGAAVGVSAQTVWRWEHGERAPRPKHLKLLKDKFGIDPAAIIERHPERAA